MRVQSLMHIFPWQPEMQPRVALRDYRFLNLGVRWVQTPAPPSDQVPEVIISAGEVKDGPGDRIAALDITLLPDGGNSGYEITLKIVGILDLDLHGETIEEEKLSYLATLNGATILYGIVRAEIASLTSNFPGGRFVLPAVYMHEIIQRQSKEAAARASREAIQE